MMRTRARRLTPPPRPVVAALLVAGVVGCGSSADADSTRDRPSAPRAQAARHLKPLPWQRAVRVAGRPGTVRIVYVSYRDYAPRSWTVKAAGARHVLTLLFPPLRGFHDAAAVPACVTVRSRALADRRRLVDGATYGDPIATRDERRTHYAGLAAGFHVSGGACPLLRR